ncbi:agmatine deiminase family protein, partial [Stenotrophomonas sp. 3diitr2024]|uniref:agmatine deiminase family protein n=1 Tax=Stenotrophomonas sp. 3diitr2024 TaxID=3345115 RepID=UPI0035CBB716
HPDRDRASLSADLADWLQQDRVLWLDHGYLEGDDTDAHIAHKRQLAFLAKHMRREEEATLDAIRDALDANSETELCPTCANSSRERSQLCVVESPADRLAIENATGFRG